MRMKNRRLIIYYVILIVTSLAGIAYGFFFSEVFFPGHRAAWIETLMTVLKSSWLVALPYAILNYYSLLRYPAFSEPAPASIEAPLGVKLYFRFVTRGENPTLVRDNLKQARALLDGAFPRSSWRLEVVTDKALGIPSDEQLHELVVPAQYALPHGTRYKARALHYALGASEARAEDWIIHLDEETRFDLDTVRSIAAFVSREQTRAVGRVKPRIGQGIILYGQGPLVNWLTTLADSLRVGDDYGRFRLQFEHGVAPFGMHGSFIVCRNDIEQTIGFDHGFEGSITEDAYFALMAQAAGVRFGFIHAFMYERSPFTLGDFVRQRRRWFGGLWLCALTPRVPGRQRAALASFMALWSISWFCILMVFVNIIYPTGTPLWLALTGGLSFSYYVLLYLVGYVRSFDWRGAGWAFAGRLALQVLLIPFFAALEGVGVIYALVNPPKDFYIVQKETRPSAAPALRPAFWQPAGLRALRFQLLGYWRQLVWFPTILRVRLTAMSRRLEHRDTATGLFTYAYWLLALYFERGKTRDVACVSVTVRGLERLKRTHGEAAAEAAWQRIGASLMQNIRPYDIACRPADNQVLLALVDCKPSFAGDAAGRVAGAVTRQTVNALNTQYDAHLSLGWQVAPVPAGHLTFESLTRLVQLMRERQLVRVTNTVETPRRLLESE